MTDEYRLADSSAKAAPAAASAAAGKPAPANTRKGGRRSPDRSAKPAPVKRDAAPAAVDDDSQQPALIPRRIRRDQLLNVTTQLAVMTDTGITLSTALAGIAEQEPNPSLKAVLEDLKKSVESGESFSEALAKHPKHFDVTYLSLIKASESSGTLAEMLERIAEYQTREMETRGKVRAAMMYPAVMAVLSTGVSVFLLTYIFPKFTPLFARRGALLPLPTRIMMTISDTMLGYWYLWLLGLALAVAAVIAAKTTARGRQVWDGMKINIPLFGPMFRKVIIGRSIRTLGTMLAAGVPTLEALRLCGEICANYYYERLWKHVSDKVTEGSAICAALTGTPLLPRTLIQMISAGEETGKLDVVLERVSTQYDKEVENAVKAMTSLIEPLMMCIMGVVVGGIAMGLMLPIFSLTKQPG